MNRIRELRESFKIRQIDLAKKLNISQGTLSNWERGVHDPSSEDLGILAEFFHVSTDYLLGRETKNPVIENDNGNGKNIVTMIGRDGRQEKRILTDEQFKAWLAMMEQMPDADNL